MKIQRITSRYNNDFCAVLECEHCGWRGDLLTGYNDHYYHANVIPAMRCEQCGKNRAGEQERER